MSRNSDKANTVLFRYQEQRAEANGYIDYNSTQRPRAVQKVSTLKDAEAWRKQVLTEINQKVTKIQDVSLSDYQLRDLNDEINKLMRERVAWEYRIKDLGGADYKMSSNSKIAGGVVIRGYRYFGRAKELPGVKELLEKQQMEQREKQQMKNKMKNNAQRLKELEQRVGLEYYGYRDEEPRINADNSKKVLRHAKDILGDLLQTDQEVEIHADDDDECRADTDALLKYERKITRQRLKQKKQCNSPEFTLDSEEPPTLQQMEKIIVDRRRLQLEQRLNL